MSHQIMCCGSSRCRIIIAIPSTGLLIAQSLEENIPVITADRVFARYSVELIW